MASGTIPIGKTRLGRKGADWRIRVNSAGACRYVVTSPLCGTDAEHTLVLLHRGWREIPPDGGCRPLHSVFAPVVEAEPLLCLPA